MATQHEHIRELWKLYLMEQASPDQVKELLAILQESDNDVENDQQFSQALASLDLSPSKSADPEMLEDAWQSLLNARPSLQEAWNSRLQLKDKNVTLPDIQANNIVRNIISQSKPVPTLAWKRWAVAASIIITIGAGSYVFFSNKPGKQDNIARTITPVPHEIQAPQANRAMISLSNGQKIYLDSAGNGKLLQQGGVEIVKLADGKISYTGTTTEVVYNTLSNPRGSNTIDMALSDGSHVWLNAGSSVTFPLAFTGNERKVSITGEAYFEIAHDATKPFFVNKGDVQVQVLGTHFNVNAYDDEADNKVTLLEGSVKILSGNKTALLRPGQQARVTEEVKVVSNVDLEEVMAWKNGRFLFNNTNIETIMRQVSRWYDVEVEYEGKPAGAISGGLSRTENISQLLKILEAAGKIKFEMKGKQIIVKPK